MRRGFRDEDVECLIAKIEQGIFTGDLLAQQAKRLKLKCKVWDDYVAQLCMQLIAIADEMDSQHKTANIAKMVGGTVGRAATVGAAIALGAGTLLAIPTAGASLAIAARAFKGVRTGAKVATAGVAVIADTLERFNKKKALELLQNEMELRGHIIECLQELQLVSGKYEELIHPIIKMKGSCGQIFATMGTIDPRRWSVTTCHR